MRRPGPGGVGVGLLAVLFAGTAILAPSGPGPAGPPGRDPSRVYQVDAVVLETHQLGGRGADHGPELCAGDIADSLPPQCGGFPVVPFRWDDVPGKETMYGTTWARVHLIGTFDSRAFHPTAPPSAPGPAGPPSPDTTGCPAPAGGWSVVDGAKVTEDDLSAAWAYASAQPDLAAAWGSWPKGLPVVEPSWPKGPPTGTVSHRDMVLNLGFTGDIDHHAREARAIWGGGLCVTRMARTRPELTRVADNLFTPAVQAAATQAGVYLLGGGPDETANVVKVEVLIADAAAQRWVDGRYGPGVVVLDGSLKPLR